MAGHLPQHTAGIHTDDGRKMWTVCIATGQIWVCTKPYRPGGRKRYHSNPEACLLHKQSTAACVPCLVAAYYMVGNLRMMKKPSPSSMSQLSCCLPLGPRTGHTGQLTAEQILQMLSALCYHKTMRSPAPVLHDMLTIPNAFWCLRMQSRLNALQVL